MRVAFVNMLPYSYYSGRKMFAEPVHLLPMHNNVRAAGHQSMIFQFGYPSDRRSMHAIRRFAPDVLGLSYIGHNQDAILAGVKLVRSFSSAFTPKLMLGGTDVDHYFGAYLETFGPLYMRGNGNFVVVTGPGENVIRTLAGENFRFRGQKIVNDHSRIPLAGLKFNRPYSDLRAFNMAAQVIWERYCRGECFFCPNEAKAPEYRTPEQARAEAIKLQRMGAKKIGIASPNFLTSPKRGSEIIATVPPDIVYGFPARVDSLYHAISRYPEVWERFRQGENQIELGVERFLAAPLLRIGKYRRLGLALKQKERLEFILNFFKGSATALTMFIMPFDWRMDLQELETEMQLLGRYITEYTPNVIIIPELLGQMLGYSINSPFAKQGMQKTDYYRYERDPRCLMLAMLIKAKIGQIYGKNVEGINDSIEMYNYVSIKILRALLASIRIMKSIRPEQFDIDAIVELMRGDWKPREILNAFYAQLPAWQREAVKRDFEQAFLKQFPELAPQEKQGLLKRLFA